LIFFESVVGRERLKTFPPLILRGRLEGLVPQPFQPYKKSKHWKFAGKRFPSGEGRKGLKRHKKGGF